MDTIKQWIDYLDEQKTSASEILVTLCFAGFIASLIALTCGSLILLRGKYRDYKQKRRNQEKVETYKKKAANNFNDFEIMCLPDNLVNDSKIVKPNDSAACISNTFEVILQMDFAELRNSIQLNRFNCSTVLRAFGWRAIKVNRSLNCITEVIMEAFTQAECLDYIYFNTNKPKPPLLGLPFSVKSNFYVKGYDATVGLAALLENKAEKTAPLVQFLSDQGAVPFVLTNVPQGLLSYITSNPLYGTTKNPWDFNRTPGGSSGGEAALMAAGGASFGIGNDLVGSLRIPAAFCGLVSLKPTQDRLHESHMNAGLPGRGRLGLSVGFYTKTVADQEFLLRQIVGHPQFRELCPQSSSAALGSTQSVKPPVIGYFADDGFSTYAPSNRRAVLETVEALKRRGYECKEFDMNAISPQFPPIVIADMLFKNVMPDNGAYMASMYSGEYYDKFMSYFISLVCIKQWLPNSCLPPVLRLAQHTPLRSPALQCLGGAVNEGLSGARQNQENTDEFKWKWIEYWKSIGIDALICPSFITPAQPFKSPIFLSTGVFITGLFNMLDVPAGVVPVCPVRAKENDELAGNDFLVNRLRSAIKDTSGLPNAVQVVALPNEEEMCLRVMRAVEEVADGVQQLAWKHESSMKGDASENYFDRRSVKEDVNDRL